MMPINVSDTNNIIGKGGGLSATSGASIVRTLAKKLQKPRAVAQNNVGNTSTVLTYTITKAPAIPNFAKTTKNGIQKVDDSPRKRIIRPPNADNPKSPENDFFMPSLPYSRPAHAIATSSLPPLAKLLL